MTKTLIRLLKLLEGEKNKMEEPIIKKLDRVFDNTEFETLETLLGLLRLVEEPYEKLIKALYEDAFDKEDVRASELVQIYEMLFGEAEFN